METEEQQGYDFKRLFSLSEYYDRDRSSYYNAIQSVRNNNMDMTDWLEYFVDGLKNQLTEVRIKGEIAIKSDIIMDRIRKLDLNERQQKILLFLLEKRRSSVEEIRQKLSLVRRTIQRDLLKLITMGMIKEIAKNETDPTKYYELL